MKETELYPPIKAFLEAQGYEVKAEVGDCDVLAVRGGEEPVVVELKTGFTLPLVFQGIRRQTVSETVYLAVPAQTGGGKPVWRGRYRDIKKLCRMLGLGLLTVAFKKSGAVVDVHLDPAPYAPRKFKPRQRRLLKEHARRVGDPNSGGSTRTPIITAYRQDALRCARYLLDHGPTKAYVIHQATGVVRARRILYSDHYGWFERVDRGIYRLTPAGEQALEQFAGQFAEAAE